MLSEKPALTPRPIGSEPPLESRHVVAVVLDKQADGVGVHATITTPRLWLRSAQYDDACFARQVFADAAVMQKFAEGTPRSDASIAASVTRWAERWRMGDVYSGFTVFERNSNQFIGHVVLGHTGEPGRAELAVVQRRGFWGQGFGREACDAVVHHFAPETVRQGFKLDGVLLGCIVATARLDNVASVKIMETIGMALTETSIKWGALRNHYHCLIDVAAAPSLGLQVGGAAASTKMSQADL